MASRGYNCPTSSGEGNNAICVPLSGDICLQDVLLPQLDACAGTADVILPLSAVVEDASKVRVALRPGVVSRRAGARSKRSGDIPRRNRDLAESSEPTVSSEGIN
jgi:hypothetical protein